MVLWDITKCHPVTDFHCEDGSPSCFFCHCFLRNECPEEGSPSSKAASVQFQMDSDGMSLLPPSLSLSLSLPFALPWDFPSFSRFLAKSLDAAASEEGVFYVEDFDRPQTRHECLPVSFSPPASLSGRLSDFLPI